MPQELQLVRYASIREDLAAAGLPIDELPERGSTTNRSSSASYFDAATLAAVEAWARPDCERFGYEWYGESRAEAKPAA